MTISTHDEALAGMQPSCEFYKAVTGSRRASFQSLLMAGGYPGPSYTGNDNLSLPQDWTIVSSSVANPTTITVTGHPWSNGDIISISGHTGSTPILDGIYTITSTGADTFTIPVNVTVGGSGGVACGRINAGGPGLTGWQLTNLKGQIPFISPSAGKNIHLARFQATSSEVSSLLLCDRLWHNGGISLTKTTEQIFTDSLPIPSRDINGTNVGLGVYAAAEIVQATATNASFTLKYENTEGVEKTISTAFSNQYDVGLLAMLWLNTGDLGIRRCISITNASTMGSKFNLFLYRIISRIEVIKGYASVATDLITSGFPRVYDGTVPFLMYVPRETTSPVYISGQVIWTQG